MPVSYPYLYAYLIHYRVLPLFDLDLIRQGNSCEQYTALGVLCLILAMNEPGLDVSNRMWQGLLEYSQDEIDMLVSCTIMNKGSSY